MNLSLSKGQGMKDFSELNKQSVHRSNGQVQRSIKIDQNFDERASNIQQMLKSENEKLGFNILEYKDTLDGIVVDPVGDMDIKTKTWRKKQNEKFENEQKSNWAEIERSARRRAEHLEEAKKYEYRINNPIRIQPKDKMKTSKRKFVAGLEIVEGETPEVTPQEPQILTFAEWDQIMSGGINLFVNDPDFIVEDVNTKRNVINVDYLLIYDRNNENNQEKVDEATIKEVQARHQIPNPFNSLTVTREQYFELVALKPDMEKEEGSRSRVIEQILHKTSETNVKQEKVEVVSKQDGTSETTSKKDKNSIEPIIVKQFDPLYVVGNPSVDPKSQTEIKEILASQANQNTTSWDAKNVDANEYQNNVKNALLSKRAQKYNRDNPNHQVTMPKANVKNNDAKKETKASVHVHKWNKSRQTVVDDAIKSMDGNGNNKQQPNNQDTVLSTTTTTTTSSQTQDVSSTNQVSTSNVPAKNKITANEALVNSKIITKTTPITKEVPAPVEEVLASEGSNNVSHNFVIGFFQWFIGLFSSMSKNEEALEGENLNEELTKQATESKGHKSERKVQKEIAQNQQIEVTSILKGESQNAKQLRVFKPTPNADQNKIVEVGDKPAPKVNDKIIIQPLTAKESKRQLKEDRRHRRIATKEDLKNDNESQTINEQTQATNVTTRSRASIKADGIKNRALNNANGGGQIRQSIKLNNFKTQPSQTQSSVNPNAQQKPNTLATNTTISVNNVNEIKGENSIETNNQSEVGVVRTSRRRSMWRQNKVATIDGNASQNSNLAASQQNLEATQQNLATTQQNLEASQKNINQRNAASQDTTSPAPLQSKNGIEYSDKKVGGIRLSKVATQSYDVDETVANKAQSTSTSNVKIHNQLFDNTKPNNKLPTNSIFNVDNSTESNYSQEHQQAASNTGMGIKLSEVGTHQQEARSYKDVSLSRQRPLTLRRGVYGTAPVVTQGEARLHHQNNYNSQKIFKSAASNNNALAHMDRVTQEVAKLDRLSTGELIARAPFNQINRKLNRIENDILMNNSGPVQHGQFNLGMASLLVRTDYNNADVISRKMIDNNILQNAPKPIQEAVYSAPANVALEAPQGSVDNHVIKKSSSSRFLRLMNK